MGIFGALVSALVPIEATKRKFIHLFSKTMADRNEQIVRYPSWHRHQKSIDVLNATLKPITTSTPPHSPYILSEWLEASETSDDLNTFLHHAEAFGLSQSDQISLAYEFVKALLNLDLIGEQSREDRKIALYLVTGFKMSRGQTSYDMTDVAPKFAEDYFLRNGATCDEDIPEEHRYLDLTVWLRNKAHTVSLYKDGYSVEGVPSVSCYDNWG